MALDERHRTSIFQALVPLAGEDAAAAMLSHFPARDVEEPVTREHLDRRVAEVHTEIQRQTNQLTIRVAALLGVASAIVAFWR